MNTYYNSVIDTVGNTPLVRLNNLTKDISATISLKCEFRNPLFSIKDRIAKAMIVDAENKGALLPGGTIIEPTSGNTGIGLAFIARAKGYHCILVMPETMSLERRTLLTLLGAELILTPGKLGMKGAITVAQKILAETPNSYCPSQFDNPVNPLTHYKTTGPEIWEATQGKIDIFIASVGTGGTFSGTTRFLKEQKPSLYALAVEPDTSAVLSGKPAGPHGIQGIGAGFIPKNMDISLIDEILPVSTANALATAQRITAEEGIPCGISTGANVYAALQVAQRPEMAHKHIVTVAPSATERYLSSPLAEAAKAKAQSLPVYSLD